MASNFFHGGHFQPQQQQHHHQPHQPHQPHGLPSHNNHHGGRTRRGPRLGAPHNQQARFRAPRPLKDLNTETPAVTAFRTRFEAGRSFDLEDDLEFCPGLLTDEDLQSIHSASSDRSSLSSGSPESSPMQQISHPSSQITPSLSLATTATSAYTSPPQYSQSHQTLKLHQPSAIRSRNAIPIVNPSTGMRVSSPPSSISPAMMQQTAIGRRW